MKHAGIVLAAGESRRMGSPKALLDCRGIPLAAHQANLLSRAGCEEVVVVLGHNAAAIAKELTGIQTVENADWQRGRLTSVVAGLKALPGYDGYFVLPVDTVGVSSDTLRAMRGAASRHHCPALRPYHEGKPGHLAWISADLASNLPAMARGAEEVRLDTVLRLIERRLDVDDPGIRNNVNTPEEWDRTKSA